MYHLAMPASAHITMVCQKVDARFNVIRVRPSEILKSLLAHGWRLQFTGQEEIECRFVRRPESFDVVEIRGTPDQVLDAIREQEQGMASISIYVWWEATEIGGHLTIEQQEHTQHLRLSMQVLSRWKLLPGNDGYTDTTWFLPKLIEPLKTLELGVAEVTSWWHW